MSWLYAWFILELTKEGADLDCEPQTVKKIFFANAGLQDCSQDRFVQNRNRKIFPRPISTLASRSAKFKTETGKNVVIITFFDFFKKICGAQICS